MTTLHDADAVYLSGAVDRVYVGADLVWQDNTSPTASFTYTATNLKVDVTSTSTDPDGTVASWAWVFGDGGTATGATASHTYTTAGTYTVGLTVTDDDGAKHTATRTVTVTAPAAAAPVYVFIQSPTVSTQQTALVAAIETSIGRTIDQRLADTDTTLGTALAAPNVIGIIADGTTAANITTNAPNLAATTNPVIYFNGGLAVTHNLGTRSDLVSGDAWTTATLPASAVGKPYAAGKAAANWAYLTTGQATPAFTVAGLGAGAQVVLYHNADPATQRVISMVYDKGAALANGATAAGRRAFGNWRNANPAGVFTQNTRDFIGGLLAWARSAQTATPTTIEPPVLASVTQTTTTANGGVATSVYTCRADGDLLLYEVSSYLTNGLPYATLAADGTTTRTRVSAELPAGPREYWARQRVGADTSPESNHLSISITASTPGPVIGPETELTRKPFRNTGGQRFVMQGTANSTTSYTLGEVIPPVWYLGQPLSGVEYLPVDHPATLDARRTDVPMKMNQAQYGHNVRYASASDPLTTVIDTKDSGRSLRDERENTALPVEQRIDRRVRIPADQTAAVGNDGHSHVIQPPDANGVVRVAEMIGFSRVDATTVNVTRVHTPRLDGAGLGPANGVRAYGGSAIAGLIRSWEIDPTHPAYTGRLDHVLAMALPWRSLKHMGDASIAQAERWNYWSTAGTGTNQTSQPGWPTGMRRLGPPDQPNVEGFIKRRMPFPVTEEDWSAPTDYFGNIEYGSLLVIPPTVTAASLGITNPNSLMVFNALRDYGAMIVDCIGGGKQGTASAQEVSSMPLYVETTAPTAWRESISGSSFTYSDLQKMKAQLRIVSNSRDWTTPNGGPLGVARRGVAL